MKATEIERKFLVRNDGWRRCAGISQVLQQAYLSRDENAVRVRVIDGRSACLTIKFRTSGLAKDEFEYEIPVEEARELLLHASGRVIEKTRYRVLHDGRNWDVDVFAGAYEGLTLAEIEMASEDDLPTCHNGSGERSRATNATPIAPWRLPRTSRPCMYGRLRTAAPCASEMARGAAGSYSLTTVQLASGLKSFIAAARCSVCGPRSR